MNKNRDVCPICGSVHFGLAAELGVMTYRYHCNNCLNFFNSTIETSAGARPNYMG